MVNRSRHPADGQGGYGGHVESPGGQAAGLGPPAGPAFWQKAPQVGAAGAELFLVADVLLVVAVPPQPATHTAIANVVYSRRFIERLPDRYRRR